jgi:hypothetical protein
MNAVLQQDGSCVIDGHTVRPIRPDAGQVVVEPLEPAPGWWAGAPHVHYDADEKRFYLYYRIRRPRGHEFARGGEARLATSTDGMHFETIWTMLKTELSSDSIERGCLFRAADGQWALAISYVDPVDRRWRTDLMTAEKPDAFRSADRRTVFTAADLDLEGVKDPFVIRHADQYLMLLSTARADRASDAGKMHDGGDVYMTGLIRSTTGIAVSDDGLNWRYEGEILGPPSSGWDTYCTRLNSVVPVGDGFVGFYDGARDESENFEEHSGVCVSQDLRSWRRLTTDGPWVDWPHATRSMRYVNAILVGDELRYYYEAARPDGSHELRVQIEPRP